MKNVRNDSNKTIINISVDGVDAAGVVGPTGAQGPAGTSITSIKQWYYYNSVTNVSNNNFIGTSHNDSTESHAMFYVGKTCRIHSLYVRSEEPVEIDEPGNYHVEIRKNSGNTQLIARIYNGQQSASNTSDIVYMNANDYFSIRLLITGAGSDLILNCTLCVEYDI